MLKSHNTGKIGEAKAYHYLTEKKYKILDTNFSSCHGELDIIAIFKKTLVIVEVKTRSTKAYGYGMEVVGHEKQRRIKKTAEDYLFINKIRYKKIRFDVISILGDEVEHIENAFI